MVNKIMINVLEPFLSKPKEQLHIAQVAREINAPPPSARQWLVSLEKKGVLRKKVQGRQSFYFLNLENPMTADYLVIAEKNKLIELCEKNLILTELVEFLNKRLPNNSNALIFGSAAESFDKANDIDLLVTGKYNYSDLKKFSDKFNKKIHCINVASLKKVSTALKTEIIKKHILIKGSEEVIRWFIW